MRRLLDPNTRTDDHAGDDPRPHGAHAHHRVLRVGSHYLQERPDGSDECGVWNPPAPAALQRERRRFSSHTYVAEWPILDCVCALATFFPLPCSGSCQTRVSGHDTHFFQRVQFFLSSTVHFVGVIDSCSDLHLLKIIILIQSVGFLRVHVFVLHLVGHSIHQVHICVLHRLQTCCRSACRSFLSLFA